MGRVAAFSLAVGVLVVASACAPTVPSPPPRSDVLLGRETESVDGRVPSRSTLAALLRGASLREEFVTASVVLAGRLFDLRRLRADHAYHLERTLDGRLRCFEYELDGDQFLRITGPPDAGPADLRAVLVPYDKERALVSLRGEITRQSPSLFAAMEVAGEGPDLSIELADALSGEIDFNSELQPGDSFRLTFEKVYREGRFNGYGSLLVAEFQNAGRVLKAFRYTVPGGKPGYYDEQGRSLRRFFLKSPLKFAAPVSSPFSTARLHPILRTVRPHLGVDYAAPAGAPVVAVSNGTVVSAGWNGEAGRMVHLRHASGYETFYMHLSEVAVRTGQHVGQGELIGRVGATGMATGPHLDYRVEKNGVFLNPLVVHRSLPPGEPIPPGVLGQFALERDRLLTTLVEPAGGAPQ
jgi:murein DD-endopeptidase MepM/ murein hydrolase activator NlpD